MNLLIPGTGLIVLGQPGRGTALAVGFGLSAEVAVCGALIAPATIPGGVTLTGVLLAGAGWLLGAGLLIARIVFLTRDASAGRMGPTARACGMFDRPGVLPSRSIGAVDRFVD